MPLIEQLTFGPHALSALPPGGALRVEPLIATEEVTLLSGATFYSRSAVGGHRLTFQPPDNFAVEAHVKDYLEAALAAGTPVHITETLSRPSTVRVWAACLCTQADFREVPGSERGWFNYSLTFLAGV